MSILKDVFSELFGMFVADIRLTAAILAVVALTALFAPVSPALAGAFLTLGTLAVILAAVLLAARKARR